MSKESFKGKVVLITGAASGIGAATAKKFAQLGSILSLLDLQSEKLQEVVEQCYTLGKEFQNPKPYFLSGDVTDDAIRKQYVDDTVKNFGRIDILVNNAGVAVPTSILTTSMDIFDKLFNIHVRAVYDMCRLSVPHLIKTKGCIVNLSSVAAYSTSDLTIYCACKAAVKHMTTCLADELGGYKVRVVAISPGPIKTDIIKGFGNGGDKMMEEWGKLTLLGRCGEPAEVAKLIAFLTSEDASYINGTDVLIDGGFVAKRKI